MKITIIQYDIAWGAPVANRYRAERLMNEAKGSDLYVLPEMFTTGFTTNPDGMAEPEDGDTLCWMRERAAALSAAVAGSVAVSTNGGFHNRFYFVQPDGRVCFYDKRHLFGYGGEDRNFTCGRQRVVVAFRGVRFLLQVCYDLRFPLWSRNRGDYDAILYVASWPVVRIAAWTALLRARAIENQCFVVGANRTGNDPTCAYNGSSIIFDAYGHELATAGTTDACAVTACIDMEALEVFRRKFPVLCDADAYTLDV